MHSFQIMSQRFKRGQQCIMSSTVERWQTDRQLHTDAQVYRHVTEHSSVQLSHLQTYRLHYNTIMKLFHTTHRQLTPLPKQMAVMQHYRTIHYMQKCRLTEHTPRPMQTPQTATRSFVPDDTWNLHYYQHHWHILIMSLSLHYNNHCSRWTWNLANPGGPGLAKLITSISSQNLSIQKISSNFWDISCRADSQNSGKYSFPTPGCELQCR